MTEFTDRLTGLRTSGWKETKQSLAASQLLQLASTVFGAASPVSSAQTPTPHLTVDSRPEEKMSPGDQPDLPQISRGSLRPEDLEVLEPTLEMQRGRLWTAAIELLSNHQLDFEEERKRILFGVLALMTIAMLIGFGTSHLLTHSKLEGYIDLSVAAGLILSLKLLRSRTDGQTLYLSAAVLFGILYVLFGFLGDTTGNRMLWVVTYPAFAFFIAGIRQGAVIAASVFSAWLLILLLPHSVTGVPVYPAGMASRFIGSYICIFIMAMFVEQVRLKYSNAMIDAQLKLERDKAALAAAEQRMRDMALEDELTGIPNRRSILGQLESEIATSRRQGGPLSVALLDLDHFKQINDTYGHPVGDRVLVEVAACISKTIRARDAVGRCGGEEFLLLLPETPFEAAQPIIERVRQAIAELDLAALIRATDEALYSAKEAGRNSIRYGSL
jgi:diguanylate cyclase (GGDEF)-like protein